MAVGELEQARVVLAGEVAGVRYGERLEPFGFTLVRGAKVQSRQLPSPGMVLDATTWPVRVGWRIDENVVGATYPIVIGAPGFNPTGQPYPASPALLVETAGPDATDRLLVAGHRTEARGSSVRLYRYTDPGDPPVTSPAVFEVADGQGRVVSIVTPIFGFGAVLEPGEQIWVGWSRSAGGLRSRSSGGLLRGAGDVITWLLTEWTDVPVDRARLGAVRARLNAYQIDTWLNAPVDPVAWIAETLLPLLPIEPRQGPDGLWYAVIPTEATKADAVARLDADAGELSRESALEIDSASIVNEVTVEYGPDRDTGSYRFRVTLSATTALQVDAFEGTLADSRVEGSYRAALSQRQFGRRSQKIQAAAVWDPATAARIAADVIARQALPQRYVDYRGGPELEALDVGQIVTITDADVQLDDHLAVVLDVEIGGPDVLVSLQLLDDPVFVEQAMEAPAAPPAPPPLSIATVAGGASPATTAWAMANPLGITGGDLLLLVLEADGVTVPDPVPGWTEIVRDMGGGKAHLVAWRIADGKEGATTTVTVADANELCGWIFRIQGHDPSSPIHAVTDQHRGARTDHAIAPATATVDGCLGITTFGFDGGHGGTFTLLVGGGTYTIQDQQASGGSADDVSACYATHLQATAGTCPDCTFESGVADGSTMTQILIAPAPP